MAKKEEDTVPSQFDTWNPVRSTSYGRVNFGASMLGAVL